MGQIVYSAMCSPTGGMIDVGTLFRLGPDLFRWIGGDEFGGTWLRQLAAEREMKVNPSGPLSVKPATMVTPVGK